jgi:hypothetical protein
VEKREQPDDATNDRGLSELDASADGPTPPHVVSQRAKGFDFDLWLVGKDGQNLERVTTAPGFDGFCVFSPYKYLVWASSRAKPDSHEMNLFIAKWAD